MTTMAFDLMRECEDCGEPVYSTVWAVAPDSSQGLDLCEWCAGDRAAAGWDVRDYE